jgi:transcription elongation factor GreA
LASQEPVTLLEAIGVYVSNLRTRDTNSQAQQELLRFVNWCGSDRAMQDIKPVEIGMYGEQAVGVIGGSLAAERLQEVRKFLTFAKKKGLIEQNLAPHLRIRKGKSRSGGDKGARADAIIELTVDGHRQLSEELEKLKAQRAPIAAEIGRAAADKDVRENVPLEAAREQLGLVESRVGEIESTLKVAVIVDPSKRRGRAVSVGARLVLKDLATGRETRYTLVSASEANPLGGKISDVSPVGKALLNRVAGDEIEVESPRGTLQYRVVRVTS